MEIKTIKDTIVDKADDVVDDIQEVAEKAKEGVTKAKKDFDRNRLAPVFKKDLGRASFKFPKMIVIKDTDERLENPICKGSIGFMEKTGSMKALALYTGKAGLADISFYPNLQEDAYYSDPFEPSKYINLHEYFTYFKNAQVAELKMIARTLGAKSIKISIAAEKKSTEKKKKSVKVKGKAKKIADESGEVRVENDTKTREIIDVCAETIFGPGSEPQMPELKYFKNDPIINELITARMSNKIQKETYTIKYSSSLGIKKSDVVKIGAMLKKFNMELNIGAEKSFLEEIEEENRWYFDYEIEF